MGTEGADGLVSTCPESFQQFSAYITGVYVLNEVYISDGDDDGARVQQDPIRIDDASLWSVGFCLHHGGTHL